MIQVVPEDFGIRLRTLRELRGLSTRELSRELEGVISQSGISRMENGAKQPTVSDLVALSWVFGVNLNELTDEIPLSKRAQWAARSSKEIDISEIKSDLMPYLELRNTLDEVLDA